jgi:O-antigen ligase
MNAEKLRTFFLGVLFFSIPFSIAGNDFAIIGLYLVTVYLFVRRRESWESTPVFIGLLIFLAGAVVSSLFSDEPLTSFSYFRNFWRLGLPFLVLFALKKRDHHPFVNTVLVISCLVGVYSIVQSFTGIDWLRSAHLNDSYQPIGNMWLAVGAFSHHLTYGGVSLILFAVFTPSIFNKALSVKRRLLYAMGSICNLSAIILCLGRSIWLGAITAIGIMILLKLRLRLLVGLILLVALGMGLYTKVDPDVKAEFFQKTTIGRRISSYTIDANIDRIMMWTAAMDIISDHPILGLGPKRSEIMQPYYDKVAAKQKRNYQHKAHVGVHNIYLQNWIDFGLLGLIGFLSWWLLLIGNLIITLRHKPVFGDDLESLSIGLVAAFTGILVAGFFENNFRDGEVQTAILTAMGLGLALIYKKKTAVLNSQNSP